MKNIALCILTFGLTLLLQLGCSPHRTPVACSQIQENELRTLLRAGPVTLTEALEWLHASSFKNAEITSANFSSAKKEGRWGKENGPWYSADFRNDTLLRVDIKWESFNHIALEPIGDEIISCFGTPDFYHSYLGGDGKSVTLSLWYPKKGTVVFSRPLDSKDKSLVIDGNIIMSGMTLVAPGTIETTVSNVDRYGFSTDDPTAILESLKSWPDTWDKIVIDNIKASE
jgi:hypothetical protein